MLISEEVEHEFIFKTLPGQKLKMQSHVAKQSIINIICL